MRASGEEGAGILKVVDGDVDTSLLLNQLEPPLAHQLLRGRTKVRNWMWVGEVTVLMYQLGLIE